MAKKYLLYIHQDQFEAEPQKSKLVNDLLDGYYRISSKQLPKAADVYTNVTDKPDVYTKPERDVYTCKNGHLANDAGKCFQKGCKYGA